MNDELKETIICAGFGGQGIMVMGKVLANAGMNEGYHVTWLPSYGAEVRGGTAHAVVRISSRQIASPGVYEAGTGIMMNSPSLEKFGNRVKKGGLLIVNTSLVNADPGRSDVDIVAARFTEEAEALGNIKVANMIAVGAYARRKGILEKDSLVAVIEEMAAERKNLISINVKALERGMELAG
jgi:2-oxoglutarate ferredoxin oxidoreductase subunit gamma